VLARFFILDFSTQTRTVWRSFGQLHYCIMNHEVIEDHEGRHARLYQKRRRNASQRGHNTSFSQEEQMRLTKGHSNIFSLLRALRALRGEVFSFSKPAPKRLKNGGQNRPRHLPKIFLFSP